MGFVLMTLKSIILYLFLIRIKIDYNPLTLSLGRFKKEFKVKKIW